VATPIECPNCQNSITIKDIRPGRFRIKCPRCGTQFVLIVPSEAGASPTVATSAPEPALSASSRQAARSEVIAEEIVLEVPKILASAFPTPPVENDDTVKDQRKREESLDPPFQTPRSLGGYRVDRRIGLIRVGTAFEARRKATGRGFALAVVKPRWSALPVYVSRIAQEAYASSQIEHPNLLSPLDFNIDHGFPFVASDALQGTPLSEPEGREGLDRSARVAAVLHVARGLKNAHEQGIYHRDLSLNKIRVDRQGLVRLADLGVGLTPETPEVPTIPAIALAGMPPEALPEPPTAAFVRQDISSLGRSLQGLIGGNLGDRALPPSLAAITRKMLGENPEDRLNDMGAVVRALETELGVGVFTPKEEEAAIIEAAARAFEEPPLAGLRSKVALGCVVALGLFVALALFKKPLMALPAIGLGAITWSTLIVLRGTFGRDPISERTRDLILGGGSGNVLTALATVGLVLLVMAYTEALGFWIFLGVVGVGLGSAYHFAIDRPLHQLRLDSIGRAKELIRRFRRLGIFEDSIRAFVARQSGQRWEEFYEGLFGYDALRSARARWGLDAGGKKRPRFARWRDPIVDAIDARIDARKRLRDRALFQAIEERALEARGINLLTARRKAHRIAEAIVLFAHQFKKTRDHDSGIPLMDALNRVAQRPDDYLTTHIESDDQKGPPPWRDALDLLTRTCFGPRTRFLTGGVLLAASLVWMHQNKLIHIDEIKNLGANAPNDHEKAVDDARKIGQKTVENVKGVVSGETRTKQLEVEGLSPEVTSHLDGFGLGVAGLTLILSSFFRGTRFALFAVPGALIAALGPHLIEPGARSLGPTSLIALAIGAGLSGLGVVFGRTRE
jgi:eukaryotic-like serine/threonine-protein kinase